MRLVAILVGVMACLAASKACDIPSHTTRPALPQVTIDMDLPPEQRWKPAVDAVKPGALQALVAHFDQHFFSLVPPHAIDALHDALQTYWPEHYAEVEGLANATGLPLRTVVSWSFYHDLAHTNWTAASVLQQRDCTGILVAGADGRVVHGRNHDDPFQQLIRPLALHLTFTSGGKEQYSALSWYWFGGTMETFVKRGAFTLEENWRTVTSLGTDVIDAVEHGVASQGNLLRRAAANTFSYAEAVAFLADTPVATALYIIISGAGAKEGAVITRAGIGEAPGAVKWPVVSLANTTADFPVLVQTNYDRWEPDPKDDARRTAALATLRSIGVAEAATDNGVACVANSPPVYNSATIFTAVLRADEGVVATYLGTK